MVRTRAPQATTPVLTVVSSATARSHAPLAEEVVGTGRERPPEGDGRGGQDERREVEGARRAREVDWGPEKQRG